MQPTEEKRNFAHYASDIGLMSRICKELKKINNNKTTGSETGK